MIFKTHVPPSLSSCAGTKVYTYHYDTDDEEWIKNGRIVPPGDLDKYISISNGVLVAAISDHRNYETTCGVVYKLSETKNSVNGSLESVEWNKAATLKTKSDPLTGSKQFYMNVSVQDDLIYTGRFSYEDDNGGRVFVHDISDI